MRRLPGIGLGAAAAQAGTLHGRALAARPRPGAWLAVALVIGLVGCGGGGSEAAGDAAAGPAVDELRGTWRAVLLSPGGELPFTLVVGAPEGAADTPHDAPAVAFNGPEEVPFTTVSRRGEEAFVLRIDGYDSEIVAARSKDGSELSGFWRRPTDGGGEARLPFHAWRGDDRRFLEPPAELVARAAPEALPSVTGTWEVRFGGERPAVGEFRRAGRAGGGDRIVGTFVTPTGDHRYLAGDYRDGVLRLSAFDGTHAFLYHAVARPDGSLEGEFWSRDASHSSWTARRVEDPAAAELPDAFDAVDLVSDDGRLHFSFEDLSGEPVSLSDERFAGKVVIVNLFGSWCPNCNDEAPLLVDLHRRYRDRGLEVVGLAFEYTGDAAEDRERVARYAERHDIDYPLLLAGESDKSAAAAVMPDLERVAAFPTTIFVGRDGTVRRIHTGFAGPATGAHHDRLVAEFERTVETLIAEDAP